MSSNIHEHSFSLSSVDRALLMQHESAVVWFTGLSGSGKSTIANSLEQKLFKKNVHTFILDGDNVRMGLNKGLGFSEEDRNENLRRIAEVAKLMADAGLLVICCFVSPLIKDREMVRSIIGNEKFVEIFVDTPLAICEKRDVKGLYKKARAGEIENFTGISSAFETPIHPDIHLQTEKLSVEESSDIIIEKLIPIIGK